MSNQKTRKKLKGSNKKLIVVGATGLVVIIIAIVAILAMSGGGYEDAIKGSISLVNKKTEGDLAYQEYTQIKEMREYNKLSMEAFGQEDDQWKKFVEQLEAEFGDNYKVSYQIQTAEELKGADFEEVKISIEESYKSYVEMDDSIMESIKSLCEEKGLSSGDQKKLEEQHKKLIKAYDEVEVTASYKVSLNCEIKGSEKEATFAVENVFVTEVNGEWILTKQKLNPSSIVAKALDN